MLFFADSGEGAVTQAVLMGSVATVIVVDAAPDRVPRQSVPRGVGGVRPVAMERTLRIVDEALGPSTNACALPCDASGNPVS